MTLSTRLTLLGLFAMGLVCCGCQRGTSSVSPAPKKSVSLPTSTPDSTPELKTYTMSTANADWIFKTGLPVTLGTSSLTLDSNQEKIQFLCSEISDEKASKAQKQFDDLSQMEHQLSTSDKLRGWNLLIYTDEDDESLIYHVQAYSPEKHSYLVWAIHGSTDLATDKDTLTLFSDMLDGEIVKGSGRAGKAKTRDLSAFGQ